MANKRKITVIFLVALTVLLAGITIYIGYKATQKQSAQDSDAATGATYSTGYYINLCGDDDASDYNQVGGCSATCNPSSGSCTGSYVYMYTCDGNKGLNGECTSNEQGPATSYQFNATCGKTQQIDVFSSSEQRDSSTLTGFMVWYSGDCSGSDSNPGTPDVPTRTCGQTCTQDSDCINSGAICNSSTHICELDSSICPSGHTLAGANCECDTRNLCGERCGMKYGKCQTGYECTYTNTTSKSCPWNDPATKCMPDSKYIADYNNGYSVSACTQIDDGGHYLIGPSGKTKGFTDAEIQAACTRTTTQTHLGCVNNTCAVVNGSGANECMTEGTSCGTVTVTPVCVALTENGSDPVLSAEGNYVQYKLQYKNGSSTNPYPNIKLKVGTSTSVGRDGLNTSNVTVSPEGSPKYDSVTKVWTYLFRWEAFGTNSSTVTAGTYDVRVMLDGTTVNTETACTQTLTVNTTAAEEPLFTVVKTADPIICTADTNDTVITYNITVKNIGAVSGTITNIVDSYDSRIDTLGLTLSDVTSSGVVSGGKVTWTGSSTDRTYASNQSRTFTYKVTVPASLASNFTSEGLLNTVNVTYDTSTTTNNNISFDLRTSPSCLPNTALSDNTRLLLIAFMLIVAGVLVYRLKIGEGLMIKLKNARPGRNYEEKVLGKVKNDKK